MLDAKAALLNAKRADELETVFVRPHTQYLVEIALVACGVVWKIRKAVHGLRVCLDLPGALRGVGRHLARLAPGPRQTHACRRRWRCGSRR